VEQTGKGKGAEPKGYGKKEVSRKKNKVFEPYFSFQ
jgi:hypothetical protein